MAPVAAGTGLRLILRLVGGLLLIGIGGLGLLDRFLLVCLSLVAVGWILFAGLLIRTPPVTVTLFTTDWTPSTVAATTCA